MKRLIFTFLALLVLGAPANAQNQNGGFSFQVDSTRIVADTNKNGDNLTEAEEDAAYAGDKSDIRTDETDDDGPKVSNDILTPAVPAPPAVQTNNAMERCNIYKNERARLICQDRMMKIDRMKAAREKRREMTSPVLRSEEKKLQQQASEAESEAKIDKIVSENDENVDVNVTVEPTVTTTAAPETAVK